MNTISKIRFAGRIVTIDDEFAPRFWSRVRITKTSRCWIWRGARNRGYGVFYRGNRRRSKELREKASRIAWQLHNGRVIPRNKLILHHCDNPPCCRPLHLYLGTNRNNMADMMKRDRHARGDASRSNVKLTKKQVRLIRSAVARGVPQRDLAKRFKVGAPAICMVANRKSWRDVL